MRMFLPRLWNGWVRWVLNISPRRRWKSHVPLLTGRLEHRFVVTTWKPMLRNSVSLSQRTQLLSRLFGQVYPFTTEIDKDWEEKKVELHKDRLRIVEKDLVEQWKGRLNEVDKQY